MKKFLPILFSLILLFSSCGPDKSKELTPEQLQKEKDAIVKLNNDFNKASQEKNWTAMIDMLSKDVLFFGTDSAEVIKTFAEFKKKMTQQWATYESLTYGNLVDVCVQMDNQATFASIFFGVPLDLIQNGHKTHYFLRGARTLKKEDEKWVIVTGIVGIAKSSEEVPTTPPQEAK
jgi:ketosteroid isomerase-like protein